MTPICEDVSPTLYIPHLNRLVTTGRGYLCTIRRPVRHMHTSSMPFINLDSRSIRLIPHSHCGIVATRRNPRAIRRERQFIDNVGVSSVDKYISTRWGIPDMYQRVQTTRGNAIRL